MTFLSLKTKRKTWEISLAAFVALFAWLLQMNVLNGLTLQGAFANLPLTMTILWGFVFGSNMPNILPNELRKQRAIAIFIHQSLSGSVSGLLFGALFAAIYATQLPIYPFSYPIVGWVCGYFSLRNVSSETLACIPITLLSTVAAEFITACQLTFSGQGTAFSHLAQIALPEGILNALIAPFVYFPMRSWYEFFRSESIPT